MGLLIDLVAGGVVGKKGESEREGMSRRSRKEGIARCGRKNSESERGKAKALSSRLVPKPPNHGPVSKAGAPHGGTVGRGGGIKGDEDRRRHMDRPLSTFEVEGLRRELLLLADS